MGAQYTRRVRIRVDPATTVSGVLALPRAVAARHAGALANAAIVLGHGAGADMTNAFLSTVHEGLAARGAVVLKFNFAYIESGRKVPDPPSRLIATYRAAVAWLGARPEARGRALVLGGKSMGGRIASHLVALGDPADGLVFLGYPLHPAGRPDKLRDAHLEAVRAPMLFVTGTRDPLCNLELLRPVLARIGRRASLALGADGDHSFHVRKSSGRDDAAATKEVVMAAARWLARRRPLARPTSGSPRRPKAAAPGAARGKRSPGPSSSSGRGGTSRRR
jgi:predicted alpha/beta-hydrolase family hydrolase